MTDSASRDREFWRLVDDSFNDSLSDDDLRALEQQLVGDIELQRRYLRLCRMHADLQVLTGARRALHRTRLALESAADPSRPASVPITPPPVPGVSLWGLLTDSNTWTNRFVWVGALAIAVSFYGIFGLLVWSMSKPPLHDEATPRGDGEIASPSVVQINELAPCDWEPGHSPHDAAPRNSAPADTPRSQPLRQYHLMHGVAEILLAQGARVTLTGPARFDVLSANSGYLHRGKLVAQAPPQAIGFTVETQLATIVDRGTEFGVEVDDQGVAEVHVIKGKVDVAATDNTGSVSGPVRVRQNEAVRVGANKSVTRVEFDRRNFAVATAAPATGSARSPDNLRGLRLWLRADRGVKLDAAGNVEQWTDLSGNGFDATQSEPARRPQWTKSTGVLGTAAIHFDGVDDYLQSSRGLDIDNGADSTLFFLIGQFDYFKPNLGIFSLRPRTGTDWSSPDGFALACSSFGIKGLAAAGAALLTIPGSEPLQMDATLTDAGPYVVTITRQGGAGSFRVDGFTKATDRYAIPADDKQPSVNTAGYLIGARVEGGQSPGGISLFAAFEIAEILICDRALRAEESAGIEIYLKRRGLDRRESSK